MIGRRVSFLLGLHFFRYKSTKSEALHAIGNVKKTCRALVICPPLSHRKIFQQTGCNTEICHTWIFTYRYIIYTSHKYIIIYLKPQWPLFLKVQPPETSPNFHPKQGDQLAVGKKSVALFPWTFPRNQHGAWTFKNCILPSFRCADYFEPGGISVDGSEIPRPTTVWM